ncbi:MAG: hypothetical protein H0W64_01880 [Gammaproteobacteria bacterium]|nr:hypothetical protein [Gammaproteobacteria bacterium]
MLSLWKNRVRRHHDDTYYSMGMFGGNSNVISHQEDELINLLTQKSGFIDSRSYIFAVTDRHKKLVKLHFSYGYLNDESFADAMKIYLQNIKADLKQKWEIIQSNGIEDPVLTISSKQLNDLIIRLRVAPVEPTQLIIKRQAEKVRPMHGNSLILK